MVVFSSITILLFPFSLAPVHSLVFMNTFHFQGDDLQELPSIRQAGNGAA
jgi:hypothetical protein